MRRLALVVPVGLFLVGLFLMLAATLGWSRSVRVTSEELHRGGGVPPGWTFTMPPGDAARGKEVFAALECYSCHEVTGAGFPAKATDRSGPNLTRMGAHHPAEYFGESILDPNAVIIDAPGFYDEAGRSTMPSYADSVTLEQWVNLVAYLKSLTGGRGEHAPARSGDQGGHAGQAPHATPDPHAGHGQNPGPDQHAGHGEHGRPDVPAAPAPHAGHGAGDAAREGSGQGGHLAEAPPREKAVGEYRVRVEYAEPGGQTPSGYLTVWVSDAESGQPVPYLPVQARIGKSSKAVTLAPVIGPAGPHYGAAITIPATTNRVRVSLGAATVRVTGAAGSKYRTSKHVSFDW